MNKHLVGHGPGETDLVGDHHHRPALAGEILHHGQYVTHQLRIQSGGGLVEEHRLRPQRQGPGNADALLLAALELVRVLIGLAGEPDLVQQLQRLGPHVVRRLALHDDGADGDVPQHTQAREEMVPRENHRALRPQRRQIALFRLLREVHTHVADRDDARVGPRKRLERTQH
jgi:hypothetical protein